MNRLICLTSIFFALVLHPMVQGQSRVYAKFGANGETVGIYNLSVPAQPCGSWNVFEGAISSVNSWKQKRTIEYRFAIENRTGELIFEFTLGHDDMSQSDVRDLINRRNRVRVRACRKGRYWSAGEVTRL